MKEKTMNFFRNSALCAACVLLASGAAEAKPDKGNGGKGGGKPGHSEKQKGGGKHENKGKPDKRLYLYGNRIVRVYEPRREVIDLFEVPTIRFD